MDAAVGLSTARHTDPSTAGRTSAVTVYDANAALDGDVTVTVMDAPGKSVVPYLEIVVGTSDS